MSQWRTLNAITNLRRTAADVTELCDLVIYGSDSESVVAQRFLVTRMKLLAIRLQRAQAALGEGGAR
jgi:hypothetical protein